jgi:hypothetical protein
MYFSRRPRFLTSLSETSECRGFSIRNPYSIVVLCLASLVIGVVSIGSTPMGLFPPINFPEAVVATFYNGMPPQRTDPLERWFTNLEEQGLSAMMRPSPPAARGCGPS